MFLPVILVGDDQEGDDDALQRESDESPPHIRSNRVVVQSEPDEGCGEQ